MRLAACLEVQVIVNCLNRVKSPPAQGFDIHGFDTPGFDTCGTANEYGARNTPRSVTIAVINSAGVTSNAGLYTRTPSGAVGMPYSVVTSAGDLCSIGISTPLASFASIVDDGAAT